MPTIRMLLLAFTTIVTLPEAAKAGFINWTSYSNPAGTTTVFGQMTGSSITATISGTGGSARIYAPLSFINNNYNWTGSAFTPNLPNSDALYFENLVAGSHDTWTIGFSAPVVDPVFHFLGLERTYSFNSAISLLSADNAGFIVSGTAITGNAFTPNNAAGTIQFLGTYTTLTITGTGVPGLGHNRDGVYFQVGATEFIEPEEPEDPTTKPEPSMAILMIIGIVAIRWRIRRPLGAVQRSAVSAAHSGAAPRYH